MVAVMVLWVTVFALTASDRYLLIPPRNGILQTVVGFHQCLDVPLLVLDQVSGGNIFLCAAVAQFVARFEKRAGCTALKFAINVCTAPQRGHDLISCHVIPPRQMAIMLGNGAVPIGFPSSSNFSLPRRKRISALPRI